jgi:hypothetical protein
MLGSRRLVIGCRAVPRPSCSGVSALACAVAALLLSAPAAHASLDVFYSAVGNLALSTDATGTNGGSGTVQVDKPAGATVKKAFLFAASTGTSGFTPPDGEVQIDGEPVRWDVDPAHVVSTDISSVNVVADVTSLVDGKIAAASPGRIDFTVTETDTFQMDGEILAVVFDDPAAAPRTIVLLYGTQSTDGDHFAIGLANALKPSSRVVMSLGISYGFQQAGQYSQVDVDGTRLTTSAGGQDDGAGENGALITVGGLDDSTDDPADPFAVDDCDAAPRCDDELYDLKPFVASGDTSIDVDTLNPSNDDNILFAAFDLSATSAVVGKGVVLTPSGTTSQVGTTHAITALAQDEKGLPEIGRVVTLDVVSGPNAGRRMTANSGVDGKARFSYSSSKTGTDTIEASFKDTDGSQYGSNDATHTWTPHVDGTLGGAWPYNGTSLQLYYTYGGGHRYLGNVVQGAANWNAAGTKVHISQWPGVPYAVHLPLVDVNTWDTWWGLTVWPDDCSSCGYTRTTIELNQRTLDPESDAQRTKVATHELGHALGLMHPYGFVPTSTPSLMWRGELSRTVKGTPQPYDVSRVNGMYP